MFFLDLSDIRLPGSVQHGAPDARKVPWEGAPRGANRRNNVSNVDMIYTYMYSYIYIIIYIYILLFIYIIHIYIYI